MYLIYCTNKFNNNKRCPEIRNPCLNDLTMNRMRYLSIEKCDHLTDSGIVSLTQAMPLLEFVRISECGIKNALLSLPQSNTVCYPFDLFFFFFYIISDSFYFFFCYYCNAKQVLFFFFVSFSLYSSIISYFARLYLSFIIFFYALFKRYQIRRRKCMMIVGLLKKKSASIDSSPPPLFSIKI